MPRSVSRILNSFVAMALILVATPVTAQEVSADAKEFDVQVETVLTGLFNPCGIAVRPGTEGDATEIFIADSGHYRVIKITTGDPANPIEVITDFPQSTFGTDPVYDIGPLGLAFLNNGTLVVGGGGLEDGQELLRVYDVPETGTAIKADAMSHSVGPIESGEASKQGEGDFFGLAVPANTTDAVYVTANGDESKGWILKAKASGGKLEGLEPFIATTEATDVEAPVGITISPDNYVVVGQVGKIDKPKDSFLTFFRPDNGDMLLNLESGLYDISALAYSPVAIPDHPDIYRLYATDFAWMDASAGGLFRMEDDGKDGVLARKFVSLDKPAAMAFTADGTLWVLVFGTPEEGSETRPGALLKITGKL